jgi:uncharacterized protein
VTGQSGCTAIVGAGYASGHTLPGITINRPEVIGVAKQIPLVDYLVLDGEPHLRANECTSCGARYFDRRNACASCGAREFHKEDIATEGEVRAFTIVSLAAPGVPVPFVAAVIDCGGTSVRANVINTAADPEHVRLGMKVRLATYEVGKDDDGTEAIGFGFEPLEARDGIR